jgi:hypothetical protein
MKKNAKALATVKYNVIGPITSISEVKKGLSEGTDSVVYLCASSKAIATIFQKNMI